MRLLQILPRVPPAVCGVADYAWNLAGALRDRHGIDSTFLSAGTSWAEPTAPTAFPVHRLPQLAADHLVSWITSRPGQFDAVLLHLSPYGFHPRAVPWWLAAAWKNLSTLPGTPPLLTFFHELFADGPPTSTAFWLQPLQKILLARIGRRSRVSLTNRGPYAAWLEERIRRPVPVLNVFSNFGELETLPPHCDRAAEMVMFSSGLHNGLSLSENIRLASLLARRLNLQRLHVVGSGKVNGETAGAFLPVIMRGVLPVTDVSRLLAGSRAAFSAYNPRYYGKSTLVASFAAHGLAVITDGDGSVELPDGLAFGRELIDSRTLIEGTPMPPGLLERHGREIRQWYLPHCLEATACHYAAALNDA